MIPIHGRKLGKALCEALGVETHDVLSITVRASVDEAGIVIVERYVDADNDVATVLTQYELVEREP
jgi:hypothetical protein